MKIEFLPPARAELTDAISYYNTQSEGLGYEFAAEVKRTLERIAQYPDAWFKLSTRTRRPDQERNSAYCCGHAPEQRAGNLEIATWAQRIVSHGMINTISR